MIHAFFFFWHWWLNDNTYCSKWLITSTNYMVKAHFIPLKMLTLWISGNFNIYVCGKHNTWCKTLRTEPQMVFYSHRKEPIYSLLWGSSFTEAKPKFRSQLNFHGSATAKSNILLNRTLICMVLNFLFWGFFTANIQNRDLLLSTWKK